MNITNLSLHQEFRKLAFDINKMKNQLMMILLKIYEKEIYKQYGCSTIYEYGFKYAKLSRETVQLALRTLKNTEDKPFLREKIETQGIYKVAMVARLATPETDKLYAEHVENMSKPVLFEFVKEMRNAVSRKIPSATLSENFDSHLRKASCESKFPCRLASDTFLEAVKCNAVAPKMTIELDEEAQILFNQLKKQYAKDLSNKEALKVILKNTSGVPSSFALAEKQTEHSNDSQKDVPGNGILKNSKISKQKIQNTTDQNEKNRGRSDAHLLTAKPINPSRKTSQEIQLPSRYISVQTQRQIHQKTNGKCAYPACTRPIENLHHPTPFGFNRSHESVIGLCKIHHSFCHNGVIENELKDPNQWKLSLKPEKSLFDNFYLKYKTGALRECLEEVL